MSHVDFQLLLISLNTFFVLLHAIIVDRPITSILSLILGFFNSFLFLTFLGVEFLSLLFLVIYAGAISILFLFVIMMLDLKLLLLSKRDKYLYSIFFFFFSFSLTILLLFFTFYNFNFNVNDNIYFYDWINLFNRKLELKNLGFTIFNFYLYEFFLISFILFVAMICCITLILEENLITKKQKLYKQLLTKNNLILKYKNNGI